MSEFQAYTAYVDPVLTIIVTLIFARTAVLSMKNNVKELLQATPTEEITTYITEKIDLINEDYLFLDKVLRIGKVGSQIIIEIDYIIEANSQLDFIVAQDILRDKITDAVEDIPYEKWLNINFTGDIEMTEHVVE